MGRAGKKYAEAQAARAGGPGSANLKLELTLPGPGPAQDAGSFPALSSPVAGGAAALRPRCRVARAPGPGCTRPLSRRAARRCGVKTRLLQGSVIPASHQGQPLGPAARRAPGSEPGSVAGPAAALQPRLSEPSGSPWHRDVQCPYTVSAPALNKQGLIMPCLGCGWPGAARPPPGVTARPPAMISRRAGRATAGRCQ